MMILATSKLVKGLCRCSLIGVREQLEQAEAGLVEAIALAQAMTQLE
jgi:hypothetical protein